MKSVIKLIKEKKIVLILIIILLAIIFYFISTMKFDNIKHVRKLLGTKYYDISCLDDGCNNLIAYKGNKHGKSKVILINDKGKIVAKYNKVYSVKEKNTKEPYKVTKNYFLATSENKNDKEKEIIYTINNKNGKELYKTKNSLITISDDYILMKNEKDYSLIDKNGKEKYNKISDYQTYADSKIVQFEINGDYVIIDENGKELLGGFKVEKEIDNEEYLILKDIKNKVYNYFNIKRKSIIGDSFQDYSVINDEIVITKVVENKKKKYILNEKGKQIEKEDSYILIDEVNKINKKIENNYNLYSESIYKKDQNIVLVDNIKTKELGTLNIKKNKFKKILSYKKEIQNIYSDVNILENNNDLYLQISCSEKNCGKQLLYVYNMSENNLMYNSEVNDNVLQNYIQYENGYKVIKYSNRTTNEENKGKYVVLDKDNKELYKSKVYIYITDVKKIFGSDADDIAMLFSTKKGKLLNKESSEASILNILDKKFYKYTSKNNTIILNEKGKIVVETNNGQYIKYSDDSIIYMNNKTVYTYNVKSNKTKKYKLKSNESIVDESGNVIPSYRGTLFINNSKNKKVKVINNSGKLIKTIKKVEINKVKENNDDMVYIIVKKTNKKDISYGLYLAK